jgi:hypothetical protein
MLGKIGTAPRPRLLLRDAEHHHPAAALPRSSTTTIGNAPRGALLYPRRSREELGGGSLGLMAYLELKSDGNNRLPTKRRSSSGVRADAPRDPCDKAKAGLPDIPISRRRKVASAGKTPETGAMLCDGIVPGPPQPPEHGAMPSEGIQRR